MKLDFSIALILTWSRNLCTSCGGSLPASRSIIAIVGLIDTAIDYVKAMNGSSPERDSLLIKLTSLGSILTPLEDDEGQCLNDVVWTLTLKSLSAPLVYWNSLRSFLSS